MNKVKFIKEYNDSIDKLKEINISDYNLFSEWYVNHPDIGDMVSDDIRTPFFVRNSILMEQSIYENNSDSLLNILIGIIADLENIMCEVAKMTNKLESMFDNLSDSEFEEILKKCGFKYEKVEKGQGGLFINGKKIESHELPSFIPQKEKD